MHKTKVDPDLDDITRYNKFGLELFWGVDIGLVEKPFQHTCLHHLQDCVVNGEYLAI